jgi:hypothetical protein
MLWLKLKYLQPEFFKHTGLFNKIVRYDCSILLSASRPMVTGAGTRTAVCVERRCQRCKTFLAQKCEQIGRNFALWGTFHLTNFHLNKLFQYIVCCRHFKASNVIIFQTFKFCHFWQLFPKIGRNFWSHLVS